MDFGSVLRIFLHAKDKFPRVLTAFLPTNAKGEHLNVVLSILPGPLFFVLTLGNKSSIRQ